MKVTVDQKCRVYRTDTCQLRDFAAGEVVDGEWATYLLASGIAVTPELCPPATADEQGPTDQVMVLVGEHGPQAPVLSPVGDTVAPAGADEQPGQGFDPGQHTTREVLAYLRDHPVDVARVVDLELAGQARKTILDLG